jgi:hypothetical protein
MSEAQSLIPIPLDTFGGLIYSTEMPPQNVPAGGATDCADMQFLENGTQTRGGLVSQAALLGVGNPTVNYLKTFTDLGGNNYLLFLDSLGNMRSEFPQGTTTLLSSKIVPGSRCRSTTLFGREYQAIHDGKFGIDIPRQFDTTLFDRVSQEGPGAPPTVVDAAAESAVSIVAATGANRANNIVTITTTAAHGYQIGQQVNIAGVGDATFNANGFVILTVPSTTTFTYAQQAAASVSGGGTSTLAPQIVAGTHGVSVAFITRQGYTTRLSPTGTYVSAGGRRATVTGIPTGPANIVGRVLAFTASGFQDYFSIQPGTQPAGNMVIMDNTTTTVTLDFSDTTLLASQSQNYLFNQRVLGECSGVIDYSNRLFWWGERNSIRQFISVGFDGGFNGATPLGWTNVNAGGAREQIQVVWGDAYSITGDGATAQRGKITQSAFQDFLGTPLIQPNTSYSVRVRVSRNSVLAQGTLHINLQSTIGGFTTAGLSVTAAQAGLSYAEFIGVLVTPFQIITATPADLLLQVYADGTPTNGGIFYVDNIEIFPTLSPTNLSLVRASRNTVALGPQPESFDAIQGVLSVYQNDGQRVTNAFRIREKLYFVKERGLYVTSDDNANEPASWTVSQVSSRVGTPSCRGVGIGEDWVVIAARDGLYIFWGPQPEKLSKEIQPLWNQINWQFGHTIWVTVDTLQRRIYVGVPLGSATSPNRVLMMDYRGLDSASDIAAHDSIHFSAYTGKVLALGNARKWCPWFITANDCDMIERSDGTKQLFFGNGVGNGKVYQLTEVGNFADPTTFGDDGVAINSFYQTYYVPGIIEEQQFQFGNHRKLFGYLTMYIEGSGTLNLNGVTPTFNFTLPSLLLAQANVHDQELITNMVWERIAYKMGTNALGSWFKVTRMTPSLMQDPWSPVRGLN